MSGNGLPNSSRSIANSGSPEKCDAAVKDNGSVKSNTSGAPRNQSGTPRPNMALALGNRHEPAHLDVATLRGACASKAGKLTKGCRS
jgi:hypothetical protein